MYFSIDWYFILPLDQPAYVAVGLSDDAIMGDDSVMACIPENGNIRLSSEFTRPRPNIGVTRDGVVST